MSDNVRGTQPAPPGASHPASKDGQEPLEARALPTQPHHEAATRAIKRAVEDVTFPASKQGLVEAAGDRLIPLGDGKTAPLRQILERIPAGEFSNPDAVTKAANNQWDAISRIRENV